MSTSVIKVNTPSVFTLVSNLITVEAALETVSEKEGNQSFLDLKVAFYYSRQVDKYLASGDAFVSRLSTQRRTCEVQDQPSERQFALEEMEKTQRSDAE
mmetsp:Transcript_17863/g.26375  ORF Transcript_17863/g.26375 Transcript_17863/m.26375 type:complete len:99 (-) Transcript_17863:983-1279(-)